MTDACPAIEPGGALAAPLLDQIDCQVAYYVEASYGALFGPFGFLQPVLTAALTLYVAFYGFQLITGRGNLSLSGLAPKIILIGAVLALATRWAAYQAFFFNLLYGGADQLATIMIGGVAYTDGAGALTRLDLLLQEITTLASTWNDGAINKPDAIPAAPALDSAASQESSNLPFSNGAVNLLWFSAILLALSTVGVLIITKILLGLLLAIGPVMIVAALFAATRGLFEGWIKTLALYALVPIFTMALTGGVLQVLEPMAAGVREMRAAGQTDTQTVFVLAVTVFIFAALIAQLVRMSAHLTGAWRLFPQSAAGAGETAPAERANAVIASDNRNGRVADMVVAVERSSAAAGGGDDRRRGIAAAAVPAARQDRTAPSLLSRRTTQRFRSFGERPGLQGRLA